MQVDESDQDGSKRQKIAHGTDLELVGLVMEAEFDRLQRCLDRSFFLRQAKQDTDSYPYKIVIKDCKEREAVKKFLLQFVVHSSVHVAEVCTNSGKARFVHRIGLSTLCHTLRAHNP